MPEPIDLLPEFLAFLDENRKTPLHHLARWYVLEQGKACGSVKIMVAIDKTGAPVAAGTQTQAANVGFPPAVKDMLQNPAAGLVIHHNHPPAEESFFSATDLRALAQHRGVGWLLMHPAAIRRPCAYATGCSPPT